MAITWTEMWSSFSPAGTSWQNYDIFTNKSVPKGAIAHILILNSNLASARTVGVRTDGSALNRYIKVHEAEGDEAGSTTVAMYVKVHSTTGLIETYCDSTTGVSFVITGYWSGGSMDFTETMISKTCTGGGGSWIDWTLFATNAIPKGSVCSVACCNVQESTYSFVGIRSGGTSIDRSVNQHEAESASTDTSDCTCFTVSAKTDTTNGRLQIYDYHSGNIYYCLGYFDSKMDYQQTILNLATTGTNATWSDFDVSSYLDQDGRVVDAANYNTRSFISNTIGSRTNGSSLVRAWDEHESEDGYRSGNVMPTQTDASGIYEILDDDWEYTRAGIWGYYKPAIVAEGIPYVQCVFVG